MDGSQYAARASTTINPAAQIAAPSSAFFIVARLVCATRTHGALKSFSFRELETTSCRTEPGAQALPNRRNPELRIRTLPRTARRLGSQRVENHERSDLLLSVEKHKRTRGSVWMHPTQSRASEPGRWRRTSAQPGNQSSHAADEDQRAQYAEQTDEPGYPDPKCWPFYPPMPRRSHEIDY